PFFVRMSSPRLAADENALFILPKNCEFLIRLSVSADKQYIYVINCLIMRNDVGDEAGYSAPDIEMVYVGA
ncbi:MAG: hypothetical protein K2I43_07845, partial [Alistipes sp.]|nr:hypothetical protein [Alistipes sp.]